MAANELAVKQRRLTPKGRATRDRIVSVAAQLMYEHGVAGTSLGDVQKAAGVGASQVYHYFGDKQSLIRAVIAHHTESVLGTVRPHLGRLDSMEALRAWRDVLVTAQRQRHCEGGCPLGSLVAELAEGFPDCRGDLVRDSTSGRRRSATALRPCTSRGIFGARPTLVVWLSRSWPRSKAGPCSRSCTATLLLSKPRWTRFSIESRTSGPDEFSRPVSRQRCDTPVRPADRSRLTAICRPIVSLS